jgi:hypothetical protein
MRGGTRESEMTFRFCDPCDEILNTEGPDCRTLEEQPRTEVCVRPLGWFAVVLLLVSAVMLVAGIGHSGMWIGVVLMGVAFVVVDRARTHTRSGTERPSPPDRSGSVRT